MDLDMRAHNHSQSHYQACDWSKHSICYELTVTRNNGACQAIKTVMVTLTIIIVRTGSVHKYLACISSSSSIVLHKSLCCYALFLASALLSFICR